MPSQADIHSNDYTSLELAIKSLPRNYDKTVSVVISHFKARELLERCLFGLTIQSYPANLIEVIISDDGSVDQLTGIVDDFRNCLNIKILSHNHNGFRLATVRNNGILLANGNVIICLDCDIIPVPELVEAHLRWFHVSNNVATIGVRRYIDVHDIHPSEVPLLMPKLRDYPEVPSASNHYRMIDKRLDELSYLKKHPYPCNCFHGCNIAFRKDSAVKVGLFDEGFNGHWGYEDIEFGYRLFKERYYLIYEPQALGLHQENTVISADQRKIDGEINRKILYKKIPGLEQFRIKIGTK
jgi:chondroitin synthase